MKTGGIDEFCKLYIRFCMDSDLNRIDWNHLHAFLATVETGSLSAAARTLGLTQPTLSRQISALEASLSLMLFERNGRQLALTDAGRELTRSAKDMGAAASRLSLTASGQRSELRGLVRITAGDVMSVHVMPQIVHRLRLLAPQITVEIIPTDTIQDLMRRDADIAVRHVRPEQPDLVARLLCEKTGHFYASKSYLAARGHPNTISDLARHDWIAMGNIDQNHAYLTRMGIPLDRDVFRVVSVNGFVGWEMAKAGLGICAMDKEIAAQAPQMECLLPDDLHVTFPVWLVTHREIHTSPRIRLVFDLMAEMLS